MSEAAAEMLRRFEGRGARDGEMLRLPPAAAREFLRACSEQGVPLEVVELTDERGGHSGERLVLPPVRDGSAAVRALLLNHGKVLTLLEANPTAWVRFSVQSALTPPSSPTAPRGAGGLDAPAAADRAAACHRAAEAERPEAILGLRRLISDDMPFLFAHGGEQRLGEVRFAALSALQSLLRLCRMPAPSEPVTVRRAMTATEARQRAQAARRQVGDSTWEGAERDARRDLAAERVSAGDLELLVQYRTLQRLGLVPYERQTIDPRTYTTPLQQEVAASQVRSDRPRPHLRVAAADDPNQTLGFVYRSGRDWVLEFSESPQSRDAQRWVHEIMYGLDRQGVPVVSRGRDGTPNQHPDGSVRVVGVIARDADPVRVLDSVAAFVERLYFAELRR